MNDLTQVLYELIDYLEQRNLNYAIVGGMAVRFYGIPRPTYDIDLQISLSQGQLSELFQELIARGYEIPEPYLKGWLDRVGGMPVVKLKQYIEGHSIDVDLFVAERPFQKELLRRRRREIAEGRGTWLVSPEDLVLLKLIANRPRDQSDISSILFTMGQLDETYLRRWAEELKVTNQLEEVLRDANSF